MALAQDMLRSVAASLSVTWLWSLKGCDSHIPECDKVGTGAVLDEPSCRQACVVSAWESERGSSAMREWLGSAGRGKCRCTLYLGHIFTAPTEGCDLCKDASYKKADSEE